MKPKYPKMPSPPKTEEERLRYRILELEVENVTRKVASTQPSQNAEKADLVTSLRHQFPLKILLLLIGLKRSTFFYHLTGKVDNNARIKQEVADLYHKYNGNYGYRRIILVLRKVRKINHKKVQDYHAEIGLKRGIDIAHRPRLAVSNVRLSTHIETT